jgi:class 3 adenylate cyclase
MQVPETHYADSGEIKIAYKVLGSGEQDLLFSGGSASNIETVWELLPEAAPLFDRLGRFARLILFDRRDSGVSDPIRDDLTLEAHVADALAVSEAVGAERPVLLGAADCARSFAALAAFHPERVRGLIAIAPTARGAGDYDPEQIEEVVAALTGGDWPANTAPVFVPDWLDDPERLDRFHRYVRTCVTPRQANRLLRMSLSSDLYEVLPLVQAPTLVLAPDRGMTPSAAQVREFAELIPGADHREIPGAGSFFYAQDLALIGDLIEEFVTGSAPTPVTNRVLASVLFTDLVGSTERATELGDAAWSELLERHHAQARSAVEQHGGETVKTLGDGVLATFTGPAQAVRCAEEIIADAETQGLEVRSGIHTGEVEVGGDDISGLAVHLAARIMGEAGAGEIMVSRTVRDLVVGSELRFSDRGEHELKGVEEPWKLYEVA